jgi:hypothetical protein
MACTETAPFLQIGLKLSVGFINMAVCAPWVYFVIYHMERNWIASFMLLRTKQRARVLCGVRLQTCYCSLGSCSSTEQWNVIVTVRCLEKVNEPWTKAPFKVMWCRVMIGHTVVDLILLLFATKSNFSFDRVVSLRLCGTENKSTELIN